MENNYPEYASKNEVSNAIDVLTRLYAVTSTATTLQSAISDKLKELIAKL